LINHIQSRGRGRSSDAEFIVLLEATDVHTRTQLEALKKAEIDMIDALERNLKATEEEFVRNSKRFVVKETGVAINLENSEWMLDEYCAMLPKDDSGKPQFAEYSVILNDDNTIYVAINLPSVVPTEFRSIEGSLCKTEKFAKATAAYEMLLKLDSVGELDFLGLPGVEDANMNLDFYKERKLDDMAAAQASKTRDYFRTIPKRFQAKFEPGCQTYLNIYRLKSRKETRFLSIGFLTISKLSEQEMSFKSKINGDDYEIEIFKMNQLYELDEERYKMITKFHYGLLQISSRQMSEEVDYSWSVLCVPLAILTPDYVNVECDPVDYIDVYSLEKCYMDNGDTKLTNLDYMYNLESLVLIDPYRFKTVFYPTSIEFDKNPGSSPDHETEKSFESIEKVYTLRFMCEEPIDMTQPIIRAHSVGFLFCAGVIPKVFPTMSLIPQLCKLSPFTRLQVNESLYLPLLFTLTWQRCMALELSHTLKTDAIPLNVVQQCLTSASASMTVDYERLETYGDAFLKAFLSTHFFIRYPIKNEGILTTMRTQYENNKYLYDVSVRLGVEGMILCQPLSRRTWIPPCNGFKQTHYLSDKTVADITEALIGAAVYYEDINAGVELIRRLFGESFESSMEPYRNEIRARNQLYSHKTVSKSLFRSIEEIETRIGYVFKYKHLMAEALTHSSYSGTHDCYQRLEFLGDAILGFLVTDNLYRYSPPMNPGQLTQCKSEFVCNQFLGWISLDLKLPAHLRHMNESIALSISNYNGEYESIKSSLEEYTTAPWYDLESSPKVLSDMFESMLGAVYVDSGLDMEVTEKILHNILSPWEKFIQITIKSVLNKSLKNDALENVNVSEVRERDGETISELSPKKLKRGNEKEESEYDIPQESGKKYDGYEINIPYMELEEETSYGKLEWDD
jgi:endoribonuclease Dicer